MEALGTKLYPAGIRTGAANTLSHANSIRPWKIYADFTHLLIEGAHTLYRHDTFALELDETL